MSYNPRIEWLERSIGDGKLVPQPTAMDEGKVPTVDSHGEYVLEELPKELPVPTSSDAGKVITVNQDGDGYELSSSTAKYTDIETGGISLSLFGSEGEATKAGALAGNGKATGVAAFAHGRIDSNTSKPPVASGDSSVAFGLGGEASGNNAAVFGQRNIVSGNHSFASGSSNNVSGNASGAIGSGLNVSEATQFACGRYNDSSSAYFIVGGGTNSSNKANAFEVFSDGTAVCKNLPQHPISDGNYVLGCSVSSGSESYAWSQPSGGGQLPSVTFSFDGEAFSCDKSYNDIEELMGNSVLITISETVDNDTVSFSVIGNVNHMKELDGKLKLNANIFLGINTNANTATYLSYTFFIDSLDSVQASITNYSISVTISS